MFRHQGKKRTAKHNLQIAVVLSFVAGMVNVTGFCLWVNLPPMLRDILHILSMTCR